MHDIPNVKSKSREFQDIRGNDEEEDTSRNVYDRETKLVTYMRVIHGRFCLLLSPPPVYTDTVSGFTRHITANVATASTAMPTVAERL